ncbi:hypothetical protein OUHCRE11_01820 [Enterobacter asburiae]|nr:hypothetical protein ENTKAS01_42640 [Enterobacter sp. AS-1]
MIGDNLALFSAFFQGLNFDLNQKQTPMLTMFNHGESGKDHVNDMYMQRYGWLSKKGKNINRSDFN